MIRLFGSIFQISDLLLRSLYLIGFVHSFIPGFLVSQSSLLNLSSVLCNPVHSCLVGYDGTPS